jgi:CDP-glucose 4,6-dehydratase
VTYSYQAPVETYSTNIMGTVHLLDAVRQTGSVRAVVNVTSDKCYENKEWQWGYREIDPMGGYDPYSSSKGCAEIVTAAYRNSYFNPADYPKHGVAVASARAGNVIGGGDWAQNRLIPDILQAIQAGKQLVIRCPNAIRPWQHVLEPLSGYLMLAEKLYLDGANYAESWNFGPNQDDAKTVQWLIEHFMHSWGEEGASWRLDEAPQLHEANYLKLDCSKAQAKLGWCPRWSIGYALENVVAWHKASARQADMANVCFQQITDYTNGALDEQYRAYA